MPLQSGSGHVSPPTRPRILLVTDPGPDPDDVKALLVLATLHIDGVVDFAGCIANGGGAPEMRARLARCLLDRLGATDVPVAVGSAGQLVTPQPHEYALPGYDEVDPARLGAGPLLMLSVLATSPPGSLTVVLISSLRDFADAINEHGELVSRAVKSVSVMGGLERSETAQFGWVADSSVNNGFDPEGAQRVYDWCFAEGVPLSVVSRFAVPLLPMQLARSFAERTNSDVLKYLADAQFLGLEGLWSRLCDGKLPPRCSKQWFFETFCGVTAADFEARGLADQLTAGTNIRERLNGNVKPYDVIALMAALPQTRSAILEHSDGAHVEVVSSSGRAVRHLLLLKPEHAPEQRHVVLLLRETYHKTAFLTQALVNERSVEEIDRRLMHMPSIGGSMHKVNGRVRGSPQSARAPKPKQQCGSALGTVGVIHSMLGDSSLSARRSRTSIELSEDGIAGSNDELELVRDAKGLLSADALAKMLSAAADDASSRAKREGRRFFVTAAILMLVGLAAVGYSLRGLPRIDRFPLMFGAVVGFLFSVVLLISLSDAAHSAALARTAGWVLFPYYAIGTSLVAYVGVQELSCSASLTNVSGLRRAGKHARAFDETRAAWLFVLAAFGAFLCVRQLRLLLLPLNSVDPERRVRVLWQILVFVIVSWWSFWALHEVLCLAGRCVSEPTISTSSVLWLHHAILSLLVLCVCPPGSRARLRAGLRSAMRCGRALEPHTPLIALLGLQDVVPQSAAAASASGGNGGCCALLHARVARCCGRKASAAVEPENAGPEARLSGASQRDAGADARATPVVGRSRLPLPSPRGLKKAASIGGASTSSAGRDGAARAAVAAGQGDLRKTAERVRQEALTSFRPVKLTHAAIDGMSFCSSQEAHTLGPGVPLCDGRAPTDDDRAGRVGRLSGLLGLGAQLRATRGTDGSHLSTLISSGEATPRNNSARRSAASGASGSSAEQQRIKSIAKARASAAARRESRNGAAGPSSGSLPSRWVGALGWGSGQSLYASPWREARFPNNRRQGSGANSARESARPSQGSALSSRSTDSKRASSGGGLPASRDGSGIPARRRPIESVASGGSGGHSSGESIARFNFLSGFTTRTNGTVTLPALDGARELAGSPFMPNRLIARPRRKSAEEESADYLIVHAAGESAEQKRAALHGWLAKWRREHGLGEADAGGGSRSAQSARGPSVLLGAPRPQAAGTSAEAQLAHMPFHLARARKLLLLCGVDFARSFEAVAHLYVWIATGGSLDNVELLLLGGPDVADDVVASLDAFHVMWIEPAYNEHVQERLVRAVEIASVAAFNEVVRSYMLCVPAQAVQEDAHGEEGVQTVQEAEPSAEGDLEAGKPAVRRPQGA